MIEDVPPAPPDMAILVFSGDFDRTTGALKIATAAAASGQRVHVYFAFWGLLALRTHRQLRGKSFIHRLLTLMLPCGPDALPTSRFNMGGLGPLLFRRLMKQAGMPAPRELLALARDLDGRFIVCTASMEVMGISADELPSGLHWGGVASFAADSAQAGSSLVF